MKDGERAAAIEILGSLRKNGHLCDKGPESAEFAAWHASVIRTLSEYFLEESSSPLPLVQEFKGIIFKSLFDSSKFLRNTRVISHEGNITHMQTIEQAVEAGHREGIPRRDFQFEQALSQSREVLLCAILALRNRKG